MLVDQLMYKMMDSYIIIEINEVTREGKKNLGEDGILNLLCKAENKLLKPDQTKLKSVQEEV
uniref:Bm301 n=1 Tax=Brugia malayi TaxID=6279 RepID=A0A1I9GC20_BRUMA|nr:Bm301 [Brugia malayi]